MGGMVARGNHLQMLWGTTTTQSRSCVQLQRLDRLARRYGGSARVMSVGRRVRSNFTVLI